MLGHTQDSLWNLLSLAWQTGTSAILHTSVACKCHQQWRQIGVTPETPWRSVRISRDPSYDIWELLLYWCIHCSSCNQQTKGFKLFHSFSYLWQCSEGMMFGQNLGTQSLTVILTLLSNIYLQCDRTKAQKWLENLSSLWAVHLAISNFLMHSDLWMFNFYIKKLLSSECSLRPHSEFLNRLSCLNLLIRGVREHKSIPWGI